jgi:hypothetical protein
MQIHHKLISIYDLDKPIWFGGSGNWDNPYAFYESKGEKINKRQGKGWGWPSHSK